MMSMTHDDVDNEAPECPICLNSMGLADMIHQACTHCDYNFCYDCLRKFIKSSLPQLDEDGNRTKGCALVCPNCRHDVAQHVHDLVALRKSDLVAALPENDSELTATQLRLKYSRSSDKVRLHHIQMLMFVLYFCLRFCYLAVGIVLRGPRQWHGIAVIR
mmetsp:Transcript_19366/g.44124  ORF Transcript_19366/g.44124 Transcript_19366/m.44124 type:complete len:160 (-) Transcript_19366:708-1187(-)